MPDLKSKEYRQVFSEIYKGDLIIIKMIKTKNKKGMAPTFKPTFKSGKKSYIILGILILLIIARVFLGGENCTISAKDQIQAENDRIDLKIKVFAMEYIAGCGSEDVGFFDKIGVFFTETLGFDKSMLSFLFDFRMGVFIGLWLWIIYFVASLDVWVNLIPWMKRASVIERRKLESGWLNFLASSPWKIIPIALTYAVLMQVPILNRFLEIISLKPLLDYKVLLGGIFSLGDLLRSFIFAFYLGIFPSFFGSYKKFKLRNNLEKAIIAKKYEKKLLEAELGQAGK